MRHLIIFLKYFFLIIGATLLHLIVRNVFPFPFSEINILFVIWIYIIIYRADLTAIWSILPVTFIIECFDAPPFGMGMVALITALLMVAWGLLYFFKDHSLIIVGAACFAGMVIYRSLFSFFFVFFQTTSSSHFASWIQFMKQGSWEILLTSITLGSCYLVSTFITKRLNPKYVLANSHRDLWMK